MPKPVDPEGTESLQGIFWCHVSYFTSRKLHIGHLHFVMLCHCLICHKHKVWDVFVVPNFIALAMGHFGTTLLYKVQFTMNLQCNHCFFFSQSCSSGLRSFCAHHTRFFSKCYKSCSADVVHVLINTQPNIFAGCFMVSKRKLWLSEFELLQYGIDVNFEHESHDASIHSLVGFMFVSVMASATNTAKCV